MEALEVGVVMVMMPAEAVVVTPEETAEHTRLAGVTQVGVDPLIPEPTKTTLQEFIWVMERS